MKLGEKQVLTVVKIVDFGVYLGNDEERVLLPKKQVPEGIGTGGIWWKYFLYRDSSDRLIATTNEPKADYGTSGSSGSGRYRERWGAFSGMGDWKKDLFLPFKRNRQQRYRKEISALLHCT